MELPMRARSPTLLLAVTILACHHGPPAPVNPNAEVAVTVDNQNFSDMEVFVIRAGVQRVRIGMVRGLSTATFMVRPELVRIGGDIQFAVHPIGARGNAVSQQMSARPGDVIHLTIPP
jgi:hypothetical protein